MVGRAAHGPASIRHEPLDMTHDAVDRMNEIMDTTHEDMSSVHERMDTIRERVSSVHEVASHCSEGAVHGLVDGVHGLVFSGHSFVDSVHTIVACGCVLVCDGHILVVDGRQLVDSVHGLVCDRPPPGRPAPQGRPTTRACSRTPQVDRRRRAGHTNPNPTAAWGEDPPAAPQVTSRQSRNSARSRLASSPRVFPSSEHAMWTPLVPSSPHGTVPLLQEGHARDRVLVLR